MRGATMFSGILVPEVALPEIDWRWCAEIDPFCCALIRERHPGLPNLGDVTADDFIERASAPGACPECGGRRAVLEVIDRERPPVEVPCERCTVYCRACARRVLKPHNNCPKGARMQALSRLQNLLAVANWYGRALMFPQTHPLELEAISLYTSRYGATPDGPDSAPWCYQQNPEDVTPQNWHPPLTVPVGSFYDPRTGEVYPYGVQPANNLDPTSPAFVEPPQIA